MTAHLGVDSRTKLIHAAVATPANVADRTVLPDLLHGRETRGVGCSGLSRPAGGDPATRTKGQRSPQLEAGQPAEHEQRLADGAGGALHERALAALHPGRTVQELVRGRPAQDQCSRLGRVDACRHASQVD